MDEQERLRKLAIAAAVIRRIMVKHARGQGDARWAEFLDSKLRPEHILAIDEALTQLAKHNARQAKVIELRFFGGATDAEVGMVLGISERTATRDWLVARVWLRGQLTPKSE